MSITKELLEKDKTLVLHNEGEWNGFVSDFSAFNDAGLECEVGEFFYGLLRVLKPYAVLETGTHIGVGAAYMGMALKDNYFDSLKNGWLDTIEFLPENYKQAKERIVKLELDPFVHCHFGDVVKFEPSHKYDFILLDTEPQTRFAEFEKFYPYLREGGFIFIHDLHRHMHQIPNEEHGFAWPFGKIPSYMDNLLHAGSVKPFHLPTPRGLTGFYKTSKEDYDWK